LLEKCFEVPSWNSRSPKEIEFDEKLLTELFSDISPALFLGYITYDYGYERNASCEFVLTIKNNQLRIRRTT